jgi:hypothetical protein
MRNRRAAALGAVMALAWTLAPAPAATAADPAADSRPIRPGVQMLTEGALCTANFVFRDSRTVKHKVRKAIPKKKRHKFGGRKYRTVVVARTVTRTYLGYAAHCAGRGGSTDTDGCTTPSYPLGTRVTFVTGARQGLLGGSSGSTVGHGTLRYSSWLAMQRARVTDRLACAYNDLALVQVDAADVPKVDPTVPVFGGPSGVAGLPAVGGAVYAYGSSPVRSASTAKTGTVRGRDGAWSATVRTRPNGVPGDSGSGYLDASGRAVGVLSTLSIFPDTGANGIGSLARELAFARDHGLPRLVLVRGRAFVGPSAAARTSGAGLLGGLLGG